MTTFTAFAPHRVRTSETIGELIVIATYELRDGTWVLARESVSGPRTPVTTNEYDAVVTDEALLAELNLASRVAAHHHHTHRA